jgi:hypothetical protein
VAYRNVDLGRAVAYGSSRTAEREAASMAEGTGIEQLIKVVEALSDDEVEQFAKVVKKERKRRGLIMPRNKEAGQEK